MINRTCIIGGAGLLGRALVSAFLDAGHAVLVADSNPTAARETAEHEKNSRPAAAEIAYGAVDIGSKESLLAIIDDSAKAGKPIRSVVNCAYPKNQLYGRRFEDVSYESFSENVGLHLGGYFLTMQTFAEYFAGRGGGTILNIASVYGVIAPRFEIYDKTEMTMPVEYSAIKAAIIHLTKYAARYYAGKNIRINCLSPGGIVNHQDNRFLSAYKSKCLNKGMLDPQDIAGTAIFLVSDSSRYINGQNIIVDDGFVL